jgi:branched-chain amino acid aminotransferase
MKESIAYLNGRLVPAAAAVVSVADAGFVLGATVAEQVRTFAGRLFRFDEHLARLERGLAIVGIEPGIERRRLAEIAGELVAHNHPLLDEGDDLGLSIVVTPGSYSAFAGAPSIGPTVCLHTYPLPFGAWAHKYRTGQSLRIASIEQVPNTCWPADLKCRSRMHYYLADREASRREPGARAVLLDRDGHVTECATANILVYRASEGLASALPGTVLPGISQAVVNGLAAELGVPSYQRHVTQAELAAADEVLLTSTPWCLLAATRVEGQPVGEGVPGPLFRRLLSAWIGVAGIDIAAQAARFAQRG